MLQSTKPERLSNKEDTRKDSWISQERGSRIELVGGLGGTSGDGNSRDQVEGLRGREREYGENHLEFGVLWK